MGTPNESNHKTEGRSACADDAVDPATVGQHIDSISNAARTAWQAGHDVAAELRSLFDVRGRVNRNPYLAMAAAAGAGYVVAGGLFSPLTARIVSFTARLGFRAAAIPFMQRELFGYTEAASAGRGKPGTSERESSCTQAFNQERYCDESENTEEPR